MRNLWKLEIIVNNLVGRVLTFGGEIIDGATVLILNATGSLIASVTSNSTGDWMYPWSTDIVNFTIVGYNGDNISQGGNAYPFINGWKSY